MRWLFITLTLLLSSGARAQDLASQLYNTVAAPQRAFFDALQTSDGAYRLAGGPEAASAGGFAVLQDEDFAFEVGEQVLWRYEAGIAGRLFLFDIGASGAARQISPNAFGEAINLLPGESRLVPQTQDGVSVFMGEQSRLQLWLAVLIPNGTTWQPALSGDPRQGQVLGGASGLLGEVQALVASGQLFEFAMVAFGNQVPPLPPEDVEQALALDRDQARLVQEALNEAGFNVGVADGLFGQNTRSGIGAWQASQGFNSTGYLNDYTLSLLVEL